MRYGIAIHRDQRPDEVARIAQHVEDVGLDELWFIEDLAYNSGPQLAAVAAAATSRITIGTGIVPVTHRHPAVTAMEYSTLARLAGVDNEGDSRIVAGVGHGVTEWNAWIGERSASPLTRFEDTIRVVRALLAGERVTDHGLDTSIEDLALDAVPPTSAPVPIVAGVRGPRSLALAGRVCDGLLLAEFSGPAACAAARRRAALSDEQTMRAFVAFTVDDDGDAARAAMVDWAGEVLADPPPPVHDAPFAAELLARLAEDDPASVAASMPPEWWSEFGAIGDDADALGHFDRLAAAGVHTAICFTEPGHAIRDASQLAELTRR